MSIDLAGWRSAAPSPPSSPIETEATYALFGGSDPLPDAVVEGVRGFGVSLRRVDVPASIGAFNRLLRRQPVSFLVAWADDSIVARSVHFPPLVLVHDTAPSKDHVEAFRLAGVSALMSAHAAPEEWANLTQRLAGSAAWARIPIGRMDVAGAVQSLSDVRSSLCLSVGCSHVAPIASTAWLESKACSPTCSGWFGRIYLKEGKIVAAEIPTDVGIPALAAMLNVRSGQVLCHEEFLVPRHANIDLRVHAALLEAATCSDHQAAGFEHAHSGAIPIFDGLDDDETLDSEDDDMAATAIERKNPPSGQGGTTPSSPKSLSDSILNATTGLRGVAVCDAHGWVESTAGKIDSETVCAVVTMTSPEIQRAAQLLGMGPLRQWAVASKRAVLYATLTRAGAVAAIGDATSNLDTVLRITHQAQGETR